MKSQPDPASRPVSDSIICLTPSSPARPTCVRHIVLWLTVAAYMITYMDRVVIASAVPSIRQEFGFDMITMGWILSSFRWGYALFQIPGGWLGDRIGPRRALTLIVAWWSVFTSITAQAWSASSMAAFRFLFGVGGAGGGSNPARAPARRRVAAGAGGVPGGARSGDAGAGAGTPAAQ